MKHISKILILIAAINFFLIHAAQSQNITSYEYWFDENINSTTSIAIAPNEIVNVIANANTSTLTAGYHIFRYRFKDSNGVYSVPVSRYFTITSTDIGTYEYWFDGNIGSAVSSNITAGQIVSPVVSAATDALSLGYHSFTYRFRDADGIYSVPVTRSFIITSSDLIEYEYWFDENIDARISDNISATQVSDVSLMIDANSLSLGTHNIIMRWQDESGNWSVPTVHQFSVLVGIEELNMAGNLLLFPNPANDQLSIQFDALNTTSLSLQILDETGRKVSQPVGVKASGKVNQYLDIASLSSGVYFLKINSDNHTEQIRFVKN
jgi:hypothetical protein